MLHSLAVEWPCLSFDILPDNLGAQRDKIPDGGHTVYIVAGTQAAKPGDNKLMVMKMSQLCRTSEDSDDDNSDDSDVEEDPILETRHVAHHGGVNRVRVCIFLSFFFVSLVSLCL